jgi:3-oxoacyl-[acyl-carrier-protein] synthase III
MYINAMAHHVSENTSPLEVCYSDFGLTEKEADVYSRFYGFKHCRYDDLTLYDLISLTLRKLFQQFNGNKNSIKWLIHCHTGKIIEPEAQNVLYNIKYEFGLKNAICFGTTINNCSSTIACVSLCEDLLQDKDMAIIVNADLCFSAGLKLIKNSAICAPGCTAILVSKTGTTHHFKSMNVTVNSKYYTGTDIKKEVRAHLERDYISLLQKTISIACNNSKMTLSDVKWIVPHNVNIMSWKTLAKELCISTNMIYLQGISQYGHMFGSDNWLNLIMLIKNGLLKKNDYYLIISSGLGFINSAAIIQY